MNYFLFLSVCFILLASNQFFFDFTGYSFFGPAGFQLATRTYEFYGCIAYFFYVLGFASIFLKPVKKLNVVVTLSFYAKFIAFLFVFLIVSLVVQSAILSFLGAERGYFVSIYFLENASFRFVTLIVFALSLSYLLSCFLFYKFKNRVIEKVSSKHSLSNSKVVNESLISKQVDFLPPVNLLEQKSNILSLSSFDSEEFLNQIFIDFGVDAKVLSVVSGVTVSTCELSLGKGTKASAILALERDISRLLGVDSVRVVEFKNSSSGLALQIPNSERGVVKFSNVVVKGVKSSSFVGLPISLGLDTINNPVCFDLAKAPHLLIGVTTGSGKSVAIHVLIMSLLYRLDSKHLKFLMVDPKMLELTIYNSIPHMLSPVMTDVSKAPKLLGWLISEMESRYRFLSEKGVRNIEEFYKMGELSVQREAMPYIVLVVDEVADLMMSLGKSVESLICRLAQKSRACGIHIVLATQRPSVGVITGLIKANVPARLALKVNTKIDSRTVLDASGAESLLGYGDALLSLSSAISTRLQVASIADAEIKRVVDYLSSVSPSRTIDFDSIAGQDFEGATFGEDEVDVRSVIDCYVDGESISISAIQRKFRMGYNKAARVFESLESKGYILRENNIKKFKAQ